ncbi:MAG: hypothetical protein K6A89_04370 [Treponema sp.]|nr:hypothetical protein [Treponema sp.]
MFLMENAENKKKYLILTLVLFAFAICSQLYDDIVVTTRDGLNLFYYGIDWFNHSMGYPFPIYIFFAIWNLPILLLAKLTSFTLVTYSNPLPWIWAKGICLLFVLIDARLIYRLCKEMKLSEDRAGWASIIFMTSMTTIVPAFVIGQYECIPLCFILLGITAYIKNDMKKFFIYFSIAIVLKYFALIIFIPLILLKEKNVLKIFGKILIGLSVSVFFALLGILLSRISNAINSAASAEGANVIIESVSGNISFLQDKNSVEVSSQLANHIFDYFTEHTIAGSSAFILFYMISCIYIWLHDFSSYEFSKLTIYVCAFIYIGMFICGRLGFYYWMILTVPFISILIVLSSKPLLLLFLTTVAQTCAVIGTAISIPWFFSPKNAFQLGLIPLIYNNPTPVHDLSHIIGMLKLDTFFKYGTDLYVAIMLYFLYLSRPKSEYMNLPESDSASFSLPRYIWLFRFALAFGFVLVIYILYFI